MNIQDNNKLQRLEGEVVRTHHQWQVYGVEADCHGYQPSAMSFDSQKLAMYSVQNFQK